MFKYKKALQTVDYIEELINSIKNNEEVEELLNGKD